MREWVWIAVGFAIGWALREQTMGPGSLLVVMGVDDDDGDEGGGELHPLGPDDLAGMDDDDDEPGAGWLRDMWGQ